MKEKEAEFPSRILCFAMLWLTRYELRDTKAEAGKRAQWLRVLDALATAPEFKFPVSMPSNSNLSVTPAPGDLKISLN